LTPLTATAASAVLSVLATVRAMATEGGGMVDVMGLLSRLKGGSNTMDKAYAEKTVKMLEKILG
jgi:hypothetical protein